MFEEKLIDFTPCEGSLPLAGIPILIDPDEYEGVRIAVTNLASDLKKVTGRDSKIWTTRDLPATDAVIVIGTLQKSSIVREVAEAAKIDFGHIQGKWETFQTQVIDSPWSCAKRMLLVAGSDKRAAIFGAYTVSEQIGVSPWHWWADVAIAPREQVYALPIKTLHGEPSVQYRGIFINDEAPALTAWLKEKYGPVYNVEFYKTVFELILRMKGNFLWPAMWSGFPWPGSSFYSDDPLNQSTADAYGIVMSTSHHEPMQRDMVEWRTANKGPWAWDENKELIAEHFKEGARRAKPYESVITLGMRGEGDVKMQSKDPQATLKDVLKTQREIMDEVYSRPDGVPQVMSLYKEVLQQYEAGLEIPEDVTLLFADDNFGNIRRFPTEAEKARRGGFGLYYHMEYVGHPRGYKWINCSSTGKIHQQLTAAYRHGISKIWVFNVGDIKPMELPSSFAMALAWNINSIKENTIPEFFHLYGQREFGQDVGPKVADLLFKHDNLMALRRHEHIEPDTFSVVNYSEAESLVTEWKDLEKQAFSLFENVPEQDKAAFFQLVLHPIKASRINTELRVSQARNNLYGRQRRNTTNFLAQKVLELFDEDYTLQEEYHDNPWFGKKWNHIMEQPHYGYVQETWHDPTRDMITGLSYVQRRQNSSAIAGQLGVAVEGHEGVYPGLTNEESLRTHPSRGVLVPGLTFPRLSPYSVPQRYFELYARGAEKITWTAKAKEDWVKLSATSGSISPDDKDDQRVIVTVDWAQVPEDFNAVVQIEVSSAEGAYEHVHLPVDNRRVPGTCRGFVESDGSVSINAGSIVLNDTLQKSYRVLPYLGRTRAGAIELSPTVGSDVPYIDVPFYTFTARDSVKISLYFTIVLENQEKEKSYEVRLDDSSESPTRLLEIAKKGDLPIGWAVAVKDNAWRRDHEFQNVGAGSHTLKYRALSPDLALEKIVVDLGGLSHKSHTSTLRYYLKTVQAMAVERKLGVGIIGAGEVFQVCHGPCLLLMSHLFQLQSVCDVSQTHVDHCATKFNIPHATTVPQEVIDNSNVDVVFILTSDESHAPLALATLKAGKHVFIEKPMTLSIPSAQKLVEAEKSAPNDAKVFVGYMRRYAPSYLQAFKREVASIPKILYARVRDFSGPNAQFVNQSGTFQVKGSDFPASATNERNERLEALFKEAFPGQDITEDRKKMCRFLGSLGSHDISLMRETLGFPEKVVGVSANDPFYSAIMSFRNKDGSSYSVTYESGIDEVPVFDAHLTVYGAKKRVTIQYDSPYVKGLPIKVEVEELNDHGEIQKRSVLSSYEDAYTAELQELYKCLVDGKEIKTTAKDALQDITLFDMMYKSLFESNQL
ncbi:Myo-inositol 2-dehydrogenase [Paramyrothecium foliicola]|nr:Myo-inositol 2-dehydrogenase [Paramyrothecium foliicola]